MQVNNCSFPQAPHGDRAMRMRFWCESTRDTKNVCDTVVAHFLLFPPDELPRAFPTKARSHFPITALGECRCARLARQHEFAWLGW